MKFRRSPTTKACWLACVFLLLPCFYRGHKYHAGGLWSWRSSHVRQFLEKLRWVHHLARPIVFRCILTTMIPGVDISEFANMWFLYCRLLFTYRRLTRKSIKSIKSSKRKFTTHRYRRRRSLHWLGILLESILQTSQYFMSVMMVVTERKCKHKMKITLIYIILQNKQL